MSLPTGAVGNIEHDQLAPAGRSAVKRPRTTWGQWWTFLATAFTAGAVVWLTLLHTVTLTSLGDAWDEEEFQQGLKEATCVTYATAVLDLSKQGYTPAQITAVYLAAAKPTDPEDAAKIAAEATEKGATTSGLMNSCGTPAKILAAAATK